MDEVKPVCKQLESGKSNIAERGVRTKEKYKDKLTDDEEQRKIFLHCVVERRKLYPNFENLLGQKQLNFFLIVLSMCA